MELKDIGFPGDHPSFRDVAIPYVNGMWGSGAYDKKRRRWSDMCVCAMFLSLASYAGLEGAQDSARGILDYLLERPMADGGWNCCWWRKNKAGNKPEISSVHTTISVLEALRDVELLDRERPGFFEYRRAERHAALRGGAELLLKRRLYKKLHESEAIEPRMERLSFPCRWHYDFLRGLEWFASVGAPYDPRMEEALNLLESLRRSDGRWPLQGRYAGLIHFDMEKPGQASRWNTLRALKVLRAYR
jgi:hypothetical protein